ncbi:phosphatase PAP2 family protein [Streptomyces sp. adm13(2018)]|uniref:phosphatase PAP2 family protein n=1 Tax=Streptomyces sp. adm13(2018) TaxID=2479007 RepID=UPI0039674648
MPVTGFIGVLRPAGRPKRPGGVPSPPRSPSSSGSTCAAPPTTCGRAASFPATIAFLVWLYLRRPAHYVWSRRVLALVTGAALALHLLMPLAPPRMLAASGLVDTARVYGPSVYGATPETDSMATISAQPKCSEGMAANWLAIESVSGVAPYTEGP